MYVLGDVYVYGDKILAHVVKGSICNGQAFSLFVLKNFTFNKLRVSESLYYMKLEKIERETKK